MPAKSAKQKKLMDAAAHSPDFAKKVGQAEVPASTQQDIGQGQATSGEEDLGQFFLNLKQQ
jgi:hypothetical protein